MIPFPSQLFGVAGSGAGHSYWRVLFLNNHGNANWTGLTEIEMHSTIGGADQCTGGTATASSSAGGGSAAGVFDNNFSGSGNVAGGATNQWVAYQFSSPVEIVEVTMTTASWVGGIDRTPKDCKLQYSNDGITWFDSGVAFTWDSPVYGSTRTFPQSAFASGFARTWRVAVLSNGGDVNFTYIDELEFRATAGGADQTTAASYPNGDTTGRPTGTCSNPPGAFDNSTGQNGGTPVLNTTAFVFPSPVKVEEITIKNVSTLARSPVHITFDWLDQDNVTWHTQKDIPNLGFSSVPQTLTVAVI